MSANMEWKPTTLGKCGLLRNGVNFNQSQEGIGLPVLKVKDFGNLTIMPTADLDELSLQAISLSQDQYLKVGDTLIVRSNGNGTLVGRALFVKNLTKPATFSGFCIRFRPDPNMIDPQFAAYFIRSPFCRQRFTSFGSGTGIQNLNQETISNVELSRPPLTEQRAIARILGALDDKIELNRRMNRTLEALAQAIFKSWFVDFDPVVAKREGRKPFGMDDATAALFPAHFQETEMGPIPAGWKTANIGKIADIIDCLHSKKPDRLTCGKLLLQLNNIRDDGLLDLADAYLISQDNYDKWVSRMEAQQGDCVITNVGRVGAVAQIPPRVKAAMGRNMTGLRCRASYPFPTFLIECLLSDPMRDEITNKTDAGTILEALNVKNIPLLRIVLPSKSILNAFEKRIRPIRAKIEQNYNLSLVIERLRDTLLPQLLSGELRVGQAEKMAENA